MSRNWTRRELLTAMLGAPIALAGCEASLPEHVCEGRIVGQNSDLGHRLRAMPNFAPPEENWRTSRIVIVGGGIAGLSAARRLKRAGVDDFVVLELEASPGGTSRSGKSDRVAYPWGAHYVSAPLKENLALVELFREMDFFDGQDAEGHPLVREEFRCRDPQERLFYKGRWYEGLYLLAGATSADLAEWQAFRREIDRWVAWRDGRGRRAFALPLAAGSDDAEITALDRMTMTEWLDRAGLRSPRLQWLVDYACRDDYGLRAEQTSAWAGIFYFAARMAAPGQEPRPFITWPEGNGRLVNQLSQSLREQIKLDCAVVEIRPLQENDRDIVNVIALAADGTAHGWNAERVIFAAPQFMTPYVISQFKTERPAHVAAFEYGSWLVANLTLDAPTGERGCPVAWDNVLYDSPALGYVSATFQCGLDYGPAQWTYYFPFCDASPRDARTKLLGLDWNGCADVVLSDLARAHPTIRESVRRLDVMRWGHAMIRPRPGFIWNPERQVAARPYRGIHFAHTDLSGVALFEEAFYHGIRAAEEALREIGHASPSWLS